MENALQVVNRLIEEGQGFNLGTATVVSRGGYASATTPAWSAWTSRILIVLERLFDERSAPRTLANKVRVSRIVGHDSAHFHNIFSYCMTALVEAKKILEEDQYGEISKKEEATAPKSYSTKAFIVHGRDDAAKDELSAIISEMGLEPIVLHRQADGGRTILEKFEEYADVGYAFILLTPDEVAYLADEEGLPDASRAKEKRARPNVIFEFGYFIGRLGRARTCCLYKGDVVVPSDLNGLVYKRYERSIEEVAWSIGRELRAAGYQLSRA